MLSSYRSVSRALGGIGVRLREAGAARTPHPACQDRSVRSFAPSRLCPSSHRARLGLCEPVRGGERMRYLDRAGFAGLRGSLVDTGAARMGPTVRDGAIVLEEIDGAAELPAGVGEEQSPGVYRLTHRTDGRLFDWAHGPDAAKRFLFPPRELLATVRRNGGMSVEQPEEERPYAFVGLRSCDLHAIAVQDRVFMDLDPSYRRRRERAVFVGVNCALPGSTCFCVPMGTGPRCTVGFDLALTELEDGFVVEVGTPRGGGVLGGGETRPGAGGGG